jgi:pantoate--beta-alanine ligase
MLARQEGVDILFVPDVSALYPDGPDGQCIWVDPGPLASSLCGASRPGHFRGVTTVVSKLLNMALPDRAYFGQKDAQQALIVTRMVRDLSFPVEICVVPTVREPDGLALSSRNVYLSPEERKQATALSQALSEARAMIESGEMNAQRIEQAMRAYIGQYAPSGRIDYVTVADLEMLQPLQGDVPDQALLALAVYFGTTRLIDNLIVQFVNGAPQFS